MDCRIVVVCFVLMLGASLGTNVKNKDRAVRKETEVRMVKPAHQVIDAHKKTDVRTVKPVHKAIDAHKVIEARKAIEVRRAKAARMAIDARKATDAALRLKDLLALARAGNVQPDKRENVRDLTAEGTQDGGQQNGGQNTAYGDETPDSTAVRDLAKGEVLNAVTHRIRELLSPSEVATKQAPIYVLAGDIYYLILTEIRDAEESYIHKLFAKYEQNLPAPLGLDPDEWKKAVRAIASNENEPLFSVFLRLLAEGVTSFPGLVLLEDLSLFARDEFSDLEPLEVMLRMVTEITEEFLQSLPGGGASITTRFYRPPGKVESDDELRAVIDLLGSYIREQIDSIQLTISPSDIVFLKSVLEGSISDESKRAEFMQVAKNVIPAYRKSVVTFLSELEVMLGGGPSSLFDWAVDFLGKFIIMQAFEDVTGLPVTGTGAPDTGTGAPDTGTGAPDAGTGAPDAGTGAPDAGTGAPDAGTGPPDDETGAPVYSNGTTDYGTGTDDSSKSEMPTTEM